MKGAGRKNVRSATEHWPYIGNGEIYGISYY